MVKNNTITGFIYVCPFETFWNKSMNQAYITAGIVIWLNDLRYALPTEGDVPFISLSLLTYDKGTVSTLTEHKTTPLWRLMYEDIIRIIKPQ